MLDFFPLLRHSKGEWAGQRFELAAFQQAKLWILFGWLREDGFRRFTIAYQELARKNGKSTEAAGVGLYLLVADGEPGAECYTAATKRDQARIVHSEAVRMVERSPALNRRIRTFRDNLNVSETASKFEPLGADADTMDGLNPHGVIIDELHAHKTRDLWDVLLTATGARRQPMQYAITTAGIGRESICYEQRRYSEQILEDALEDDTFFAWLCCIDAEDDWQDESCWIKANPNLGVSVKLDRLRAGAKRAREVPGYQNPFRRLHLDEWTEQDRRWLDMEVWKENGQSFDLEALRGRPCYGGLDLSSTTDLTACVWVFPPPQEKGLWLVLPRFWIPRSSLQRRMRRDRVPFDAWASSGLVRVTDGNCVDYEIVRRDICTDAAGFDLKGLAFDRWNSSQLITQLQGDGVPCVQFGQGFQSMSAPSKELEKLLLDRQLAHANNPVLRWMASNVTVKEDPAGNLKPDKSRSTERIDGVVGLIMALGLAIVDPSTESTYEHEDLMVL